MSQKIDNIIVLPSGRIKGREAQYITITKPVQFVLDRIDSYYKKPVKVAGIKKEDMKKQPSLI